MKNRGFTAVELLVTIIIGVMMVLAGYQLYAAAQKSASEASLKARASNITYDSMREYSSKVTRPCSAQTFSPTAPADSGLTDPVISVRITCPYSATTPEISLVTATLTYEGTETVTHAMAKAPN